MNATISRETPIGGCLKRLVRCLARQCGLLVVTPEEVLEWARRAIEHARIANDYAESGDTYLEGKNDGRSEAYLRACEGVRQLNTPNAPAQRPPAKDV